MKVNLVPTVKITVVGKEANPYIVTPKNIKSDAPRFIKGMEIHITDLEYLIVNKNLNAKKGIDLEFKNIDSVSIDSCMGGTKFRNINFVNVRQVIAGTVIRGTWNLQTVENVWFMDAVFRYGCKDSYDANIKWNPDAKLINLASSVGLHGYLDFSNVDYVDLSDADLTCISGIRTNPKGEVFCMLPYKGCVGIPDVQHFDIRPYMDWIVGCR